MPRSWFLLPFLACVSVSVLASTQAGPASTDLFTVERAAQSEWVAYDGIVGSRTQVSVISRVTGRVKAVHVGAGQRVKQGELLLELEADDLLAKVRAAQAHLATARAGLERAHNEHERISRLAKKGLVSSQRADAARAEWKSAQAAIDGAEAQVRDAQTQLSFTRIHSPIDGVVADKYVNPGDFATPSLLGGGASSGSVLMTLYGAESLWIEARIPERFSRFVERGSDARVQIESAGVSLQSRFAEVAPLVDAKTRSFVARVNLPAQASLRLGMLGTVSFSTGERSVIEIPRSALVQRGQLDTVFIDDKGTAQLRLVRSGRVAGDKVEILSGLNEGERIVLNPGEHLRDGQSL